MPLAGTTGPGGDDHGAGTGRLKDARAKTSLSGRPAYTVQRQHGSWRNGLADDAQPSTRAPQPASAPGAARGVGGARGHVPACMRRWSMGAPLAPRHSAMTPSPPPFSSSPFPCTPVSLRLCPLSPPLCPPRAPPPNLPLLYCGAALSAAAVLVVCNPRPWPRVILSPWPRVILSPWPGHGHRATARLSRCRPALPWERASLVELNMLDLPRVDRCYISPPYFLRAAARRSGENS